MAVIAVQEPLETRTARQMEAYAKRLDFLKALYKVECLAGVEGPDSVTEPMPRPDRPCPRPDHQMWENHFESDHRANPYGTCDRAACAGLPAHAAHQ